MYWSSALRALIPCGVTTTTSTVVVPAGATAVMEVGELTVKLAALTDPNCTDVALRRLAPEIVTGVPPAEGPEIGLTPVTVAVKVTDSPNTVLAEPLISATLVACLFTVWVSAPEVLTIKFPSPPYAAVMA